MRIDLLIDGASLEGELVIPDRASGLVVFAHGSGSSRNSPRNRFVAAELQVGGLATLLVDLLSAEEERLDEVTRELRFDIDLLASRLVEIVDYLAQLPRTKALEIGCFGSSTGAAAALVAAAARPDAVRSLVSRGGRPDLAGDILPRVTAPTLLIVGARDPAVLELNRWAMSKLRGERALMIIPRATHLFEEPGTLEEVARLAREWFVPRLGSASRRPRPAPSGPPP